MWTEFQSLPRVTYTNAVVDLTAIHQAYDASLTSYRATLGETYPSRVAGSGDAEGDIYEVRSPLDDRLVIGRFVEPSPSAIRRAVEAARAAFRLWGAMPWRQRVVAMRMFSQSIAERKGELAMALIYQTGKTRMEALGECEEAIDLIEHYCRQMEINEGFLTPVVKSGAAEQAKIKLRPFGVFAVIAPFNYPVALISNMTAAALVTGNTVVLKASPQSGLTAQIFVEAAEKAGLPPGVLNLLFGEQSGPRLADEPGVDGIAFTGSQEVGISLLRKFAAGPYMRPVIGELGGKNPCYVTANADLEAAVEGVARSAFAFQGQKCSACSVAFVHNAIYDDFVSALALRAAKFKPGKTDRADANSGPLINEAAMRRYDAAVDHARSVGRIVHGGRRLTGGEYNHGFFVEPTIVADLPEGDRLYKEELFVPLVALRRFDDLSSALDLGNSVVSGLTAGIFSQDPEELRYFTDNAHAGALYINRPMGATTGAWPGIQSLCGWKASGLTGKGGLGPHYLPQFMREQCVTEIVASSATA